MAKEIRYTSDLPWCTVSPASGSNNGSFEIQFAEYDDETLDRTATITVSGNGVTPQTITVVLKKKGEKIMEASPTSLEFSSSAGSKTITITSNTSWNATSSAAFCTLSPASGSNNGAIAVSVTENDSTEEPRNATITIAGTGVENITVSVTLSENQGDINLDDFITVFNTNFFDASDLLYPIHEPIRSGTAVYSLLEDATDYYNEQISLIDFTHIFEDQMAVDGGYEITSVDKKAGFGWYLAFLLYSLYPFTAVDSNKTRNNRLFEIAFGSYFEIHKGSDYHTTNAEKYISKYGGALMASIIFSRLICNPSFRTSYKNLKTTNYTTHCLKNFYYNDAGKFLMLDIVCPKGDEFFPYDVDNGDTDAWFYNRDLTYHNIGGQLRNTEPVGKQALADRATKIKYYLQMYSGLNYSNSKLKSVSIPSTINKNVLWNEDSSSFVPPVSDYYVLQDESLKETYGFNPQYLGYDRNEYKRYCLLDLSVKVGNRVVNRIKKKENYFRARPIKYLSSVEKTSSSYPLGGYSGGTYYYDTEKGDDTPDLGIEVTSGLLESTSYPSGHTGCGWGMAMAYCMAFPEFADNANTADLEKLFCRAFQYCESRTILGAHWHHCVDMGRLAAAVGYAAVVANDGFMEQLDLAQSESGGQPQPSELFDELLDEFNVVLYGSNTSKYISSSNKTTTYNYLNDMYSAAETEWTGSNFFSKGCFPEVTDYRSDVTTGDDETHEALQAWLMAMCLAELVPTTGATSNNLTKLFTKAMQHGHKDLYKSGSVDNSGNIQRSNNYGIKLDAMIARFVAGAVYAVNHDSKISTINTCRTTDFNSALVNANDFDSLGYVKNSNIGYLPEMDTAFPSTPGPWANGWSHPSSYPSGLSADLFYTNVAESDQKYYNYKMDMAIHEYVKAHYNMWSTSSDKSHSVDAFANQSVDVCQLVFEAAIIPFCEDYMFFGKKKMKYLRSIETSGNIFRHEFELADNASTTCSSNEYIYDAPFSDWLDIIYPNHPALNEIFGGTGETGEEYINGTLSNQRKFIMNAASIIDDSRKFTYDKSYGRRRPLGGYESGTAMNNTFNHDPVNGFLMILAARYLTNTRTDYLEGGDINKCDDYPHDSARSYPSGHSAQSWGLAMLLGQIRPSSIKTYMKNAWRFGVCRSIGRYHWNSDLLYGRLGSLMILPIINAMNGSGFHDGYNLLRISAGLSGTTISGGSLIGGDTEGGDTPTGKYSMHLTIVNDTDKAVTFSYTPSHHYPTFYILKPGAGGHNGVNIYLPTSLPCGARDSVTLDVEFESNSTESIINEPLEGAGKDKLYIEDWSDKDRFEVTYGINVTTLLSGGGGYMIDGGTYTYTITQI